MRYLEATREEADLELPLAEGDACGAVLCTGPRKRWAGRVGSDEAGVAGRDVVGRTLAGS